MTRTFLGLHRDEAGYITVEAAIGLGALMVVVAALISGMMTIAAYLAAIDTAGAAARAQAIGENFAPSRGTVHTDIHDRLVRVTSTMPSPFGAMSWTAVYPLEIGSDHSDSPNIPVAPGTTTNKEGGVHVNPVAQ